MPYVVAAVREVCSRRALNPKPLKPHTPQKALTLNPKSKTLHEIAPHTLLRKSSSLQVSPSDRRLNCKHLKKSQEP